MAVKKTGEPDLGTTKNTSLDGASRQTNSELDTDQRAGDSSKVVWVIVALTLIFIATISYFVAQMPPKP
ncbi:MAG: hypothetical protein L0387_44670 [Acidobacteria bacterium]|nr:hypothetical protein [Acidobacteriota bacterium]MCI0628673.1 hypothetical protein [Acidobacteriota bacterium]MCI0720758.1 hypothetical protein [Acidobacteriota bacterium]